MIFIVLFIFALATIGTVQYYNAVSRRQRITARLMHASVSAPESVEEPSQLLRRSYADMLLGGDFKDEDLPALLRKPGVEARRAGLRLGQVDMLLLLVFIALFFGFVVYIRFNSLQWALIIGAVGALAPYFVVKIIAAKRVQKLEYQLADALDQIVGALQSGIGFRQALEVTRTNSRAPIKDVFVNVLVRSDLGVPFAESFRDEARSLNSKYFDLLALTIVANGQAGASMTPMLMGLVRRIRESIRFRRRVRSLTAEARFSSVVLFLMPWMLGAFIYLKNPDQMISMFRDSTGRIFVYVALGLYVGALFWTLKLLRFED